MRRTWGWVVTVLGALLLLAGLALMLVLGPDSRFVTGPHRVDTDGIAVVTAPKVISWSGLRIDVLAEVPVNKPVFVGLGNSVDVQDYVAASQRVEVTSFRTPWTARTREVEGRPALPGAPTALDWWISDSAGLGGASISTTLPDETVSLAILSVGATNLSGLQVTFAYGVEGGFGKGAGLFLFGLGGLVGGRLLLRDADLFVEEWDEEEIEVEEIVYVYVDEDGVEHEISEEEAARLATEEHEDARPEAAPETERESGAAEPRPPAIAGVVTAGDIVAGVVPATPEPDPDPEPTPEPEPDPDPELTPEPDPDPDPEPGPEQGREPVPQPEPQPAAAERVVYVFVDEDGVEHEVGEDELADFEFLDDDEEEGR